MFSVTFYRVLFALSLLVGWHTNVAEGLSIDFDSGIPAVKIAEGLKLQFDPETMIDDTLIIKRYGTYLKNDDKYRGGTFYRIENEEIVGRLLEFVKPEYRHSEHITPALLVINYPYINAHKDSDTSSTSLNFYLETGDGVTTFYKEPSDPNASRQKYPNGGELMHDDMLEEAITVEPKPHEVWLMNTKVIHSVQCPDDMLEKGSIRALYKLQIDLPYDEAKHMLIAYSASSSNETATMAVGEL